LVVGCLWFLGFRQPVSRNTTNNEKPTTNNENGGLSVAVFVSVAHRDPPARVAERER